jgi:beta-lactamase class A
MTHGGRSARLLPLLVVLLTLCLAFPSAELAGAAKTKQPATTLANIIPNTPAGEQLSWALQQVNDGGSTLTTQDIADRFSDNFLAGVSPTDLIGVFTGYLAPNGPMTVARFEGGVTATRANALLTTGSGQPWHVRLGVEASAPYRIDDLFFEPAPLPATMPNPPASWKSLDRRLKQVAPEVAFVAAEVTDGTCRPVQSLDADRELAIGSSFKLYVLGELARQIAAGTASWDEPLTLRAKLKSLPSGSMLYEKNGSVFPILTYAEHMIAESDNTATDHLIDRLGRQNIERMMATMGHSHPALNTPLLMTREWFAIKLRLTADQIAAYLAADDATRRKLLTDEVDPQADTLWDGEEWVNPYLIDSIEWFASPADLCRAMAYLLGQSSQPGLTPILDCLSLNPGIPFDAATWSYVGHKEGYETGVKSQDWLLQRTDGRWFVIAAIINDPTKEIDGYTLNQLMVPAAALLAKTK